MAGAFILSGALGLIFKVPQRSASEGTTNGTNSQSQGVNQSQTGKPFSGHSLLQVMVSAKRITFCH